MLPFLQRFTRVTEGDPLPLTQIAGFPNLNAAYQTWLKSGEQAEVPRKIDPLELPPHILKCILILDLNEIDRDAVIRLAGDSLRELYGRDPRSLSIRDFLSKADADLLIGLLYRVAQTSSPQLHSREQVSINGSSWNYNCLLLPLTPYGGRVSRVVKVVDGESLRNALLQPAS